MRNAKMKKKTVNQIYAVFVFLPASHRTISLPVCLPVYLFSSPAYRSLIRLVFHSILLLFFPPFVFVVAWWSVCELAYAYIVHIHFG